MREIKNNKQGDKVSQWTYSCGERSHEDGTFEYGLLYHDMLSYLQSTTVVRYKKKLRQFRNGIQKQQDPKQYHGKERCEEYPSLFQHYKSPAYDQTCTFQSQAYH